MWHLKGLCRSGGRRKEAITRVAGLFGGVVGEVCWSEQFEGALAKASNLTLMDRCWNGGKKMRDCVLQLRVADGSQPSYSLSRP
jgi:hypothetical protein